MVKPSIITRDEDVLDTWFSSALWAFSPLGWPDENSKDLQRFFPTSLLVTGFDIIFFWVARMMMMSLYFMKDIPFQTVYVHALVRDAKGQKMSKSKGNVIDPIDLINEHGCDAMRFGLSWLAVPGRDIKLSTDKIISCRNFATKLWNATRFAQMQEAYYTPATFDATKIKHPLHRWIIHQISDLAESLSGDITSYRFHDASGNLYQFIWGVFCDWYLEFSKNLEGDTKAENKIVTAWALENLLILLHPFMPFITSELYAQGKFSPNHDKILMLQSWTKSGDDMRDDVACHEIDWVMRFITQIRSVRSSLNLPPSQMLPLTLAKLSTQHGEFFKRHQVQISKLARVTITIQETDVDFPKGCVRFLHDEASAALLVADAIDFNAEIARLEKNITALTAKSDGLKARLNNEEFIKKAPANVIEIAKTELANNDDDSKRLNEALNLLKQISAN